MAYTTVNKSSSFQNQVLYTGNGNTGLAITGVNFKPDITWIKERNQTRGHVLFDVIRGATYQFNPNSNATNVAVAESLKSFDTDGFTVGNATSVNENSYKYVGWNWLAGGTGSANTAGSINSTVSANTTSGCSVVSYTGTGSNATVGHGLGAVPKMILVKESTGSANDWTVYHATQGNTTRGILNETNAWGSNTAWNNTTPTSSLFSIGSGSNTNRSGSTYMAYCFAEKQGYSKFGSYTGLGGTNYPFIYTGFKPAFVMAKRTDNTSNWVMYDNKRQYNLIEGQYNPQRPRLASNLSSAESSFTSDNGVDLLSNGFVVRDNSNDAYTINISGATYIYMAFGQSLVGTNNIPNNAR